MKKITLLFVMLNMFQFINAQSSNWVWGEKYTSIGVVRGIATDGLGNSYSLAADTLIKYNASGNVVWKKGSLYAPATQGDHFIAVDAQNNIYITGTCGGGGIIFGNDTLIGNGNNHTDMIIQKFDSNGNKLWAKIAYGNGTGNYYNSCGMSVAVDPSGNVYITGIFSTPTMVFGTTTLTNSSSGGLNNIFVVKYDSAGTVLWAKKIGGQSDDYGQSVITDQSGNVFVTGYFNSGTITIGTTTLTNTAGPFGGPNTMFIAKYDTNGNPLWAHCSAVVTGVGTNQNQGSSLASDASGDVFVIGDYQFPSIIFGSDTLTQPLVGSANDMFLVKYSPSGTVLWARKAQGQYFSLQGYSISTDASGNVYAFGGSSHYDSVFYFGSDTLRLTGSNISLPIFIVKYDPSGNIVCLSGLNQGVDVVSNSVATDGFGNAYINGSFSGPPFIIDADTITQSGSGYYLAKYYCVGGLGIKEETNNEELTIYPNPFTSQTTLSFSQEQKHSTLYIRDVLGKEIKSETFSGKQFIIEKGEMNAGIYFIQVTDENKNIINKKIIIQ